MKVLSNQTRGKRVTTRLSRKGTLLNRILVPVDFSECSQHALRYAEKIAGVFGATLTVLNVIPLNEGLLHLGADQMQLLDEQLRENQRRKLLGFVQDVATANPFQCMVRLGHPVQQIVKAAAEIGADAIIISTHGLTGLKHALIGSTAEHVVRHARCPVWVVPGTKQYD